MKIKPGPVAAAGIASGAAVNAAPSAAVAIAAHIVREWLIFFGESDIVASHW